MIAPHFLKFGAAGRPGPPGKKLFKISVVAEQDRRRHVKHLVFLLLRETHQPASLTFGPNLGQAFLGFDFIFGQRLIQLIDQLPGMRPLAEELVINPNTVAKAYRELEHDGVIELRHGAGAFVAGNPRAKKLTDALRAGQTIVAAAVERLRARGVTDDEIRRLFEAELAGAAGPSKLTRPGGPRG